MTKPRHPNRRDLLAGAAAGAVGMALTANAKSGPHVPAFPSHAEAFPLEAVRLTPSIWLDAVESNRKYLHTLEPDRLLHNFRLYAGLKPKGDIYGGWESETIAGHTLGHYLSACALMHAQTGDADCKARTENIVDELARCQEQHNDGYVGGFSRRHGDTIENGKLIFPEVVAGDIRVQPFDLNGAWSPLYNVHKTMAGLLDVHRHCGNPGALQVAHGIGVYLDGVFGKLDDAQVQHVLDTEFGGVNESLAELHVRTKETRFLALAERLHHKKVLDPLAEGRDELEGLHANTQIPKIITAARLYEITGKPHYRKIAETFWHAVVEHHTYVIGGNSDREHFQKPDTISKYITEQTCESCNTYNMLKLTRHLYAWKPDAKYFDYYERAHLNHILAQHNAETGMFAYMVPLMAGTAREWSKPFDSFWCCCGTGMESHAKHGDSIYAHSGDTLFVNQFVPSELEWKEHGARFTLETEYPNSAMVYLTVTRPSAAKLAVALRLPAWCANSRVELNGKPIEPVRANGYATIHRQWREGDKATLSLPMELRAEAAPDDPKTMALMLGPTLLAGDLGESAKLYSGPAPALVSDDPAKHIMPNHGGNLRTQGIGRPEDIVLLPFHEITDRNTAVYFKRFTDAEWDAEQKRLADEAAALAALDRRSIDIVKLGDEEDEQAHTLAQKISYPASYRGRLGRDARDGGYFEFQMKTEPDTFTMLQATYWGDDRDKSFRILVDGTEVATEKLTGDGPIAFFDQIYFIDQALTNGKRQITIRFEPDPMSRVGPVYGVRLLPAVD